MDLPALGEGSFWKWEREAWAVSCLVEAAAGFLMTPAACCHITTSSSWERPAHQPERHPATRALE